MTNCNQHPGYQITQLHTQSSHTDISFRSCLMWPEAVVQGHW